MALLRAGTLALIALVISLSPRAEAAPPELEPAAANPPTPEEPRKGKPLRNLGIAAISVGVLNFGYGIPLAYVCPADACFPGGIGIGFGVGFIVAGAIALPIGQARMVAHESWREQTGVAARAREEKLRKGPEPRTGAGLIAGGTALVAAGASGLIWGFAQWGDYDYEARKLIRYPAPAKASLTLGAVAATGGLVMLGFGGAFARKHRRWDKGEFATAFVPTPMWLPGGAGLGVAGRF